MKYVDAKIWIEKNAHDFHVTETVDFVIWERKDMQNKERMTLIPKLEMRTPE